MAGANFYMKIAQYKTGQYSKAHKHSSGAILVCIKGKGYSFTWPDRLGMQPWDAGHGNQVKKQTYEPVGMISAAPMRGDWFHQHFGTHPEGLRLLVFDGPYGPGFRRGGAPGGDAADVGAIDTREGGNAISYVDEDPHIRKTYEAAVTAEGMSSQMPVWVYSQRTPPEGEFEPGGV